MQLVLNESQNQMEPNEKHENVSLKHCSWDLMQKYLVLVFFSFALFW